MVLSNLRDLRTFLVLPDLRELFRRLEEESLEGEVVVVVAVGVDFEFMTGPVWVSNCEHHFTFAAVVCGSKKK